MPRSQPVGEVDVVDGVRDLHSRLEDLRALVPELGGILSADDPDTTCRTLLGLLEQKQRQLIQGNIRLTGLRELTESLLREPDEERVLRTISLYIAHAYALPEVAALTRSENGGLRGYRSRGDGRGLCESICWSGDNLKGTAWERAMMGETIVHGEDAGPAGTPPPLPLILPLVSGGQQGGDAESIASQKDGNRVLGILALRPSPASGGGAGDPLEIQQIAFQAATLFESVRQQRRALREMRFRECLLEAMSNGLIACDRQGRVTAINRAAIDLVGLDRASLVGRPLSGMQSRAPQLVKLLNEALAGEGAIETQEAWVLSAEGRIPVGVSVVRFAEGEEDAGGLVATIADLRPVRAMEAEMRRLDRLAALGRFASSVAHEIRNPLAAIGTGVDYLGQLVPPEKSAEIAMLRGEIGRLDRIVRDLLEPARARPLEITGTRISNLVQRACRATEPLARERQVRFAIRPPVSESLTPSLIEIDAERMLQVMVNLVRNAIEASPAGMAVEIGWVVENGGPQEFARLWVRDSGGGISAEDIGRIFEPFYSTKNGGTGLGLYVSHTVVEQHGGKLTAESAEGGGALMTVTLPTRHN